MELLKQAKAELLRSNVDRKHPFNTFWLGTLGIFPEVRMVVLRNATPDFRVTFFTDARSPKVSQIRKSPKVSASFYHPRKKLQLRLYGTASLIDAGEEYNRQLDRIQQKGAIKDYITQLAPGTLAGAEPIEYGEQLHFLVVDILPEQLDILLLGTETHKRAKYIREKHTWKEEKVVP